MRITNNSQQPQGVYGVGGLVFIKPGQTRDVELTKAGLALAKELAFLGIEGVARGLSTTPNSPPPADGAEPNDPPSERDDLKKQAAELGIGFPKNIATDKLKALIDAKLAE